MTRVLIITGSSLGERLAGPAIRARAMARVLAADGHDVTLATTATLDDDASEGRFRSVALRPRDDAAFDALERVVDLIVFQGHAMEQFTRLASTDRVVVVDAYDPMHLEMLEQGREEPRATWDLMVRSRVSLLNHQLVRADMVLCASARQRSFYLGQLAALGRISPTTYENDPSLEHLIAIAPFGLEAEPPVVTRPALRGVVPGIDDETKILIWGGGVYSWFDPLLLIRAVHALAQRRPGTALVFLGTRHPGQRPMGVINDAIDLAEELGALGNSVIFNEDWVPYDERGSFLSEANAGVSTHHAHVETEFSFRTRILDYLWAGLPMVVTEGDTFADLVREERLGIAVPAGDFDALADALETVLYDDAFAAAARERVEVVRQRYLWETTLEPLRRIARQPRRAPDVEAAGGRDALAASARDLLDPADRPGFVRDLRVAWHHLRHAGAREVVRRARVRRSKE
ncbi:glycosyltransferase family 4 protein [Demequina sp.]|uniref:glycosyltransferase family 4 protein n=1 Tax=Demequina sp. TaxID=2050685 RepID=UPI0025B91C91|nr:glycosyltransferase family 4 protein [Demequina sp.]